MWWAGVLGCFCVVRGEEIWAEEVGVAARGERAAGPGSWVRRFVGQGEREEMPEARVTEGVGVD